MTDILTVVAALSGLIAGVIALLRSRVDVASISSKVYTDVIAVMRLEMERLEGEINEKDIQIEKLRIEQADRIAILQAERDAKIEKLQNDYKALQRDYKIQGEIVEQLTQRIKALEEEREKLLADMKKLRRDTAPLKK